MTTSDWKLASVNQAEAGLLMAAARLAGVVAGVLPSLEGRVGDVVREVLTEYNAANAAYRAALIAAVAGKSEPPT